MSIENAILELAKAITIHAEAIKSSNKNPWFNPELLQQNIVPQPDVSFETPKQRRSKKTEVAVDPAKPGADETVESKVEVRQGEIVNIEIVNPPIAVQQEKVEPSNMQNPITSEMCKNLAKEKMAAGVDRTKIKALITEMGAESIADLTERNLVEFYTKLQEIK